MTKQHIRGRGPAAIASAVLFALGVGGCSTRDAYEPSGANAKDGGLATPDAPPAQRDGNGTPDQDGAAMDDGGGTTSDVSLATDSATDATRDRSDDARTISPDAGSAAPYGGLRRSNVVIGNVFLSQPGSIAFVSNDEAAVLMQVGWSDKPGT